MKTELLALIENYGKALVYQTEGKISAFKDAKNLMSNIVFILDKAEREEAAIGAGGVERLRSDAPAAVKPPASQRDELLQVALDFIGTLTGMSPPPIEVAPPEVFAPFYDFVDRVQAITSAAPVASVAGKPAASITLDFKQATELLDMFGGEPCEIELMTGTGHSGDGLYALWGADTGEGTLFLGKSNDDAMPDAPAAPADALDALPSRTGIYAWVSGTTAALVLVNERPSAHAPGGQLNGHVIHSTRFYDGCAVTDWGRDGRWTLLHDFDAAIAAQAAQKNGGT